MTTVCSVKSTLALLALSGLAAAAQAQLAVAGLDQGPTSSLFAFGDGSVRFITPYGAFNGGVRVAVGDITGDGTPDIITAPGPGGGPHVKVLDGSNPGMEVRSFFAYAPNFAGGIYVASGDVNNDGIDDIITGAGAGQPGGHVKVFDGVSNAEIRSFFAFDTSFNGGVRVAAGDINGDGFSDIIVGAGPGAGPHVRVFSGQTSAQLHSFFAFPGFQGGVFVAGGDVSGDGFDDIIVGSDAGMAPIVRVFDPTNLGQPWSFNVDNPNNTQGVRVGTIFQPPTPNEPNGIIAILIGLLRDNVPTILRLNGLTGAQTPVASLQNFPAIHVFVAGSPPPPPPPCRSDFNGDGNIDPDDLSDFITCFFTAPPCRRADFNRDNNIDPDDLSDYITEFFTPCG